MYLSERLISEFQGAVSFFTFFLSVYSFLSSFLCHILSAFLPFLFMSIFFLVLVCLHES